MERLRAEGMTGPEVGVEPWKNRIFERVSIKEAACVEHGTTLCSEEEGGRGWIDNPATNVYDSAKL